MSTRHDKKRTTMARNLEATTGMSVDEWVEVVDEAGPSRFGEIIEWLRREHGLGHFQARLVAEAHRDR